MKAVVEFHFTCPKGSAGGIGYAIGHYRRFYPSHAKMYAGGRLYIAGEWHVIDGDGYNDNTKTCFYSIDGGVNIREKDRLAMHKKFEDDKFRWVPATQ